LSALRAAALGYARRGWFVFPVKPRSKAPATRSGFKDATTDPGLVDAWWVQMPTANIGIDCGRSGLLIVDVDGPVGAGEWAKLLAAHGMIDTLASITARGFQLWFRSDGESSRSRRLATELETRGAGGYVIAPPSVHPAGARYEWGNDTEIAAAPDWLLEGLAPAPSAPVGERRNLPFGRRATRYGRAAIEGLVAEMLETGEGHRNAKLVRLAYRAGRLHAAGELDASAAEAALTTAAVRTGLPQDEADRTFSSGFEAGALLPALRAVR
jgi:Bifunctional DNA primase/polymerase, N-terminal